MKVIIVGCARVGAELANQLDRDGHDVTVVEKDAHLFHRLSPAFKGKTIEGIGFDRDVLLHAGIERADAVAAVTMGDNTNVITARIARNIFHVPKVVAALQDPRRAEIYQRLGLSTVAPSNWGVSRIIQLLTHREMNVIMTLGNGEGELIEVEAPPHWVSRTVSDVNVPGEINVAAIFRKGRVLIPTLGSVFEDGDQLTITLLSSSRRRLENLLAVG